MSKASVIPLLAAGALAGCVTTSDDQGNLLVAAGFRAQPANTPDNAAALAELPPHTITRHVRNGRVVYLYGDPTTCRCIYYGTARAYAAYQRLVAQERSSAWRTQDTEWGWRPWGYYAW